jgi:hypothetical protein
MPQVRGVYGAVVSYCALWVLGLLQRGEGQEVSNKLILMVLALVAYVGQNAYFGWNAKPMSDTEFWWDNFVSCLIVLAVIVPRVRVYIIKTGE